MPGEDVYSWSTTAANNDDADTLINWREGMARAAVNDSSRSSMAAMAKFRDLLKGTIVTGGTTDAQTFTSGVGYTVVPNGLRALLKIGPGLTNTTATTLSMDGITAAPIKKKSGDDLEGGECVAGGYIEIIFDGTNWMLVADSRDKVSTTGDTITGPTIINSTLVINGDGISINSLTVVGNSSFDGDVTITGDLTSDTVTATGDIVANGSLWSDNGNCFLRGVAPQLTLWDEGTSIWGIQSADGKLTLGAADTGGAIVTNYLIMNGGQLLIPEGECFKPGGGPWAAISDSRSKNVTSDYSAGLAEVVALHPVRYTYKGNDTDIAPDVGETAPYKKSPNCYAATKQSEFIGLIAQEAEQSMPEMVTKASGYIDGAVVNDIRTLNTTALTFALVNCVKELLQRIEALSEGVMRLIPIPIDDTTLDYTAQHWVPFLPKIALRTKESLSELIRKVMAKEMRLVLVWDDDANLATALIGVRLHYRGTDLIAELLWMAGSGRKQWQHLIGDLEQLLREAGAVECRPLCRRGWQRLLEANGYKLTHIEMTKSLR